MALTRCPETCLETCAALEIRAADTRAAALLAPIDHAATHAAIRVERELLRLLDGDCRLPVAAHAILLPDHTLHARAIVFHDGIDRPTQGEARGTDPESVAADLFHQLCSQSPQASL